MPPLIDGSCGYLSFVPFTNILGQMVAKNTRCKCKGQSRGNPHSVTDLSYKILQNCRYKSSYQVDFVIHVKSDCLYSGMIISCQTPFHLYLTASLQRNCPCFGAVSVMPADTSCFSCDPVILVQTPSVVYSEMSSVFTFTSCLFSALVYVLYILYSFTILQHSAVGGHWQGYLWGHC